METKCSLWVLFVTFFRIGAFTFGGGLAMMPIMRREVVDRRHWVNNDDIFKILTISESTPGVFAVNSATFIGYRIAGFKGSLVATLGVVLPSFVIISILSLFIIEFKEIELVAYAFEGIKAGVAILILGAGFRLARRIEFTRFVTTIFLLALLAAIFTSVSPIYLLLLGAFLGIVYSMFINYEEAKRDA
ncbi:MAG: chromate transporter [Acholeplasmataceae bacterium]